LPNTTVTGVHVRNGVVEGVETDRGRIESPVVVDAAGAWARQVAGAAGIHDPMVPTRPQVLITEPVEGATPEQPIVRIMDAAVCARPCREASCGRLRRSRPSSRWSGFRRASIGTPLDLPYCAV
jgi:4-methylaminobutanoate oxidase (formaldehyde-forming)